MGPQAAVLSVFLLVSSGAPETWEPIQGAQLTELLSGRTVVYDLDEQVFFANGRTRYRVFRDRWGWWELQDGRFCSLWPPSEEWTCFTAETNQEMDKIRFTDPEGIIFEGHFEP